MKLNEAKQLKHGDTLEHKKLSNADGSPMRFRVSGNVKTWKRDINRIKVPLKHGLYDNGYLVNGTNEGNVRSFNIDIKDVRKKRW